MTGIQQGGFSWKSVALAAVSGGVGGDKLFGIKSGLLEGAVRGVVGNVLGQGIGIATRLQSKFDWAGAAAAGVSGGVGGVLGGGVDLSRNASAAAIATSVGVGTARAIAGAAARSLIEGTSFGDNVLAVLPDAIGQTIGEVVAGEIAGGGRSDGEDGMSPLEKLLVREAGHTGSDGSLVAGGMGGPGDPFTVKGDKLSFEFSEDGTGTTLGVILAGKVDPTLLPAMANTFAKEGIETPWTIKDIKEEIASLPDGDRLRVIQEAYNVLNSDAVREMSYHSENVRLDELIGAFNSEIADPLIIAGSIHAMWDFNNPINHETYVIQKGDTLAGIASRRDGMTVDFIAAQNGIADVNAIRAGDTIRLPTSAYIERAVRDQMAFINLINDPHGASIPPQVLGFDPYIGAPNPYGRFGSMEGLQQAGGAEYLRLVDVGYSRGVELWDSGKMPNQSFNPRYRNRDIGNYTDDFARRGMNSWFDKEGIAMGRGGVATVYVNRRLYDQNDFKYRIPDIRIGDRYFDASLAPKSETTPQVRDFFRFGNPSMVTIVRPTAMGGPYDIPRPPGL